MRSCANLFPVCGTGILAGWTTSSASGWCATTTWLTARGVLRGVTRWAQARPHWVLVPLDTEQLTAAALRTAGADGAIALVINEALANTFREWRRPLVNVASVLPGLPFPRVVVDHRLVGRLAAAHLRERGFRHFGFVGHPRHLYSTEREAGFRAGARRGRRVGGVLLRAAGPVLPAARPAAGAGRPAAAVAPGVAQAGRGVRLPRRVGTAGGRGLPAGGAAGAGGRGGGRGGQRRPDLRAGPAVALERRRPGRAGRVRGGRPARAAAGGGEAAPRPGPHPAARGGGPAVVRRAGDRRPGRRRGPPATSATTPTPRCGWPTSCGRSRSPAAPWSGGSGRCWAGGWRRRSAGSASSGPSTCWPPPNSGWRR